MAHRLPPWWVCLVGAILLVGNGLKIYVALAGPVPAGWVFEPASGDPAAYRIAAMDPGSPATAAGFAVGDLVSAAELRAYVADAGTGRQCEFHVQRGRVALVRSLTPSAEPLPVRLARMGASRISLVVAGLLCLALAATIVVARPDDVSARWGAFVLAQVGTAAVAGATGSLRLAPEVVVTVFGPSPSPLVTLLPLALTIAFYVPVTAMIFLAQFPRVAQWRPRTWALVWLPAVVTFPFSLEAFWRPVLRPTVPMFMPPMTRLPVMVLGVAYCVAGLTMLGWHYAHLSDPNERRRVRVMSAGFVAAVLALVVMISSLLVFRLAGGDMLAGTLLASLLLLLSPVLIAHAIMRHRMFDIRVALRLGLQYALARGLVLGLVPLLGVALGADVLLHRTEPLSVVLARRGWVYAIVAAAALLLHTRREPWLDALDRRFFRERYDAKALLRDVVGNVRRAGSFEQAAVPVVTALRQALHPAFAAVMVHHPGTGAFRAVAAEPASPPDLPADSRVIGMLRLLGKPLELPHSESGWLQRRLPGDEVAAFQRAGVEWLFPIALDAAGLGALIALGPKLSQQPYSRDDEQLVETVSAALGLLIDRRPAPAPRPAGHAECDVCGHCFDADATRCPDDGSPLSPHPASRVVAERYVLERRLGRGGMGTVYEATDRRLQRRVALKVIRPDLLDATEATARFEREARAAAAFSHPNVVTVHDFGIEPGGRAYLVMELVEGRTLRSELDRVGRLPAPRALAILRGVCAAIAAAHDRQILHRDIKPENVLLTVGPEGEQAKVLDFGLVKEMDVAPSAETRATAPGVLVGTLRYTAPEQWRAESPAASWDIWALAVVAYEVLAGEYPFGGVNWHVAARDGRAIPISQHVRDAPATWDRFFGRALSADVSQRPPSAAAFFRELEAVLSATPATAT